MKIDIDKIFTIFSSVLLTTILIISLHRMKSLSDLKTKDRWTGEMEQHRFNEITTVLSNANINVSSLSSTLEIQQQFPLKK